MQDKLKNKVVSILFIVVLFGFFLINVFSKKEDISLAERRKLQQFPEVSLKKVFNGQFFSKFDSYSMDQFYEREAFRKLKAMAEVHLFKKGNFHQISLFKNSLVEQLYPLNEASVLNFTRKLNDIYNKYLQNNSSIFYSIVPDKNYYVEGSLKLDYAYLQDLVAKDLSWGKYINIFDVLDLDSYYKTDSHWKQEKLGKVVNTMASFMQIDANVTYQEINVTPFEGVYSSRYPLSNVSDEIHILKNDIIDNLTAYHVASSSTKGIYDMEAIHGLDKYDIYLSGASPLIEIDNPLATTDKELIVFRDSFGSSLVPLLTPYYKKVIVVDIRYIPSKSLGDYINFNQQDILFLYSISLINNSSSLR